jgi:hypothetical protein
MQKKLLLSTLALVGTVTLASGYLWYAEIGDKKFVTESTPAIKETADKTKDELPITTSPEENQIVTEKNSTVSTSEKPIEETVNNPAPEEELNPYEIFEAKVVLEINGIKLPIAYQDDMTAEDAMREVQTKYPESFRYEGIEYGGDLGTFVKSINGITENYKEKMHWILYINGKKSNKGISTLKLNPHDTIQWNYEKEIL